MKTGRRLNQLFIRHAPIRPGVNHLLPARLIVSLASYAPRFATLDLTLRCLLSQSVQPDAIQLWLHSADRKHLPDSVQRLEGGKLSIRYEDDDIASYRKIIPTLTENPDAFIVTADDDVCYPRDWLAGFITQYRNPNEVLCYRAHRVRYDGAELLPYMSWEHNIPHAAEGSDIFPTGRDGVFYPPGVLPPRTVDRGSFQRYSAKADDLWLYWMGSQAGRSYRRIEHPKEFKTWVGSQSVALSKANVDGSGNNQKIAAMIEAFGLPNPRPATKQSSSASA
jgi:hypothetical protein